MIRDFPRSIIGTVKSRGHITILAITPEGQAVPLFALGSSARPTILIVSSPERFLRLFRSPFYTPARPHARIQKEEELPSFTQCLLSAMAHSDAPVNGDKSLRDSRYLCEMSRINTAVAVERTTLVECEFVISIPVVLYNTARNSLLFRQINLNEIERIKL